jgi:hypothetical protein
MLLKFSIVALIAFAFVIRAPVAYADLIPAQEQNHHVAAFLSGDTAYSFAHGGIPNQHSQKHVPAIPEPATLPWLCLMVGTLWFFRSRLKRSMK